MLLSAIHYQVQGGLSSAIERVQIVIEKELRRLHIDALEEQDRTGYLHTPAELAEAKQKGSGGGVAGQQEK